MALPQKRLKFEAATLSATNGGRYNSPGLVKLKRVCSSYKQTAIAEREVPAQNLRKQSEGLTLPLQTPPLQQRDASTRRRSRVSRTWKQRLQYILAVSLLLGILPLMFARDRAAANTNVVLSDTQISQKLQQLPGWTRQGNEIVNTFKFKDFVAAIDFVNQLVEPAESAGHHPDLAIAYNQVTVSLTTHDAGGITNQDFVLAEVISQLAAE